MSTITKEQAKDLRNAFDCWQQDYDPVEDKEQYDMFGLGMVAMDALLASLEAEAVGEVVLGEYDDCGCHPDAKVVCIADDGQADWENFKDGTRLYTAPPAPVSDSLLSEILAIAKKAADAADECAHAEFSDDSMEHSAAIADWERRASMLQGGEPVERLGAEFEEVLAELIDSEMEPVTTACKLRDAVDTIRNSGIAIDGEKILAERDALNSPVIQDAWVACSERLPENKPGSYEYLVFEGLNNRVQHDYWNVPDAGDDCQFTPFWNHYGRYVTHWMPLPAAPQLEA